MYQLEASQPSSKSWNTVNISIRKKRLPFSFSTQTHILELIKELDLETYPQFNIGKKVHHMGGPGAKVRAYSTSIPALSPLVLMDLTQLLWKVRQSNKLCFSRSRPPRWLLMSDKDELNNHDSHWTNTILTKLRSGLINFLLTCACVPRIKWHAAYCISRYFSRNYFLRPYIIIISFIVQYPYNAGNQ